MTLIVTRTNTISMIFTGGIQYAYYARSLPSQRRFRRELFFDDIYLLIKYIIWTIHIHTLLINII